jgi:hypothetical protein
MPMSDTTAVMLFLIVFVAFIGAVERIYRMERTLGRINNLLADLCAHLRVHNHGG